MKKLRIVFFIVCLFVLFITPVKAIDIQNPISDAFKDIPTIISSLSSLIRPAAILAFLVMIIYGGFTKLTAAGNAENEAKAMKILSAGIIGFVIVVLAPLVVQIVGALLGVQTIT